MSEAGEFAMWLAVGGTSVGLLTVLQPLVRAWARRIEAGMVSAETQARLDALEQRGMVSGEVDLTRQRLAELEERLDFAERLLGQVRPAEAALPRTAD
jgi:uncharacterized protein YecT (DUF1311 family)